MSDLYKMLDIYNMSILCNMLGKENMPDVFFLMLGYIYLCYFSNFVKNMSNIHLILFLVFWTYSNDNVAKYQSLVGIQI